MLRIGHICYANCTPIFHGMQEYGAFAFELGVPSYLNARLAEGALDLCPSSSIEYASHHDTYLIVPDLSISSIGPVLSVLLFSPVPVSELYGAHILLTSESATSVNLLKVLLAKKYGIVCQYSTADVAPEQLLTSEMPALLIGDSAIRASMEASGHFVCDLGEEWFQWTGLPFTFGLWLTRRDVAAKRSAELANAVRCFTSAKLAAHSGLPWLAEIAAESSWMGTERLVEYWRHISYDLTKAHIRGLKLFYGHCYDCGLIDANPPLHFLEMGI
jgi:chorismate dehydratase